MKKIVAIMISMASLSFLFQGCPLGIGLVDTGAQGNGLSVIPTATNLLTNIPIIGNTLAQFRP